MMEPTDLIQVVNTALSALDKLIDFNASQGLGTDFRVKVMDQRMNLEALRMRLTDFLFSKSMSLTLAAISRLRSAQEELDAQPAEVSGLEEAKRVLQLSSTIERILDPDSFSVDMLPGNDPTKPKG
jgi:hypothetical protein